MNKIFLRILISIVLIFVALALYAYMSWSPGAPVYEETARVREIDLPARFRNRDEHDAIVAATYPQPYVLEINSGQGALIFFGAHHTSAADDPQHADIEARWRAFRPTVALYEGRRRGYFSGPIFARLDGTSESATLHQLARRDDVKMFSLEPSYQDEVSALLKKWDPEQVALYFTMRVYWSEAGGKPNEKLAEHLRAKRTNVEGLRDSLQAVADIDRVWRRDFPSQPDWRGLGGEPEGTYLAAISEDSRQIRGEHMARILIDLVRRGERVFAVVGSGHVIRLEWILREGIADHRVIPSVSCDVPGRCSVKRVVHPGDFRQSESSQNEQVDRKDPDERAQECAKLPRKSRAAGQTSVRTRVVGARGVGGRRYE